jgi:hypothetical protein
MKKQEFWDFCKGKKVYTEDEAIKEFYDNKYRTYKQSVKPIYFEQTAYHDMSYYYDEERDIIIEHSYYVGD